MVTPDRTPTRKHGARTRTWPQKGGGEAVPRQSPALLPVVTRRAWHQASASTLKDGYTNTATIRQQHPTVATPVLALCAMANDMSDVYANHA